MIQKNYQMRSHCHHQIAPRTFYLFRLNLLQLTERPEIKITSPPIDESEYIRNPCQHLTSKFKVFRLIREALMEITHDSSLYTVLFHFQKAR
ncbi:hypothetical protein WAI453_013602 [Rhynchosporium graminicola]